MGQKRVQGNMTIAQMYPEYKVARRYLSVDAFIDLYSEITNQELEALAMLYEKDWWEISSSQ